MTELTYEQQEAARRQAERKADADAIAKSMIDEAATRQRANQLNNIKSPQMNNTEFYHLKQQLFRENEARKAAAKTDTKPAA